MAEQFLYCAQICAILQEMACKGVTQHMRRDFGGLYACARGDFLQLPRKDLARQIPAFRACRKQPGAFRTGRFFSPNGKPGLHCGAGLSRKGHDALLAALAAHGEEALVAQRNGYRQAHQLRDTQTRGIEHFQKRMQPDGGKVLRRAFRGFARFGLGPFEQAAGLFLAQRLWQAAPLFWAVQNARRVVAAQTFRIEELKELP